MSPCNQKGLTYQSDAAVSMSLPALDASRHHNQIQHHVDSDVLLTSSYDELHARNMTDSSSCKAWSRARSIHFYILRKRKALNKPLLWEPQSNLTLQRVVYHTLQSKYPALYDQYQPPPSHRKSHNSLPLRLLV
jgi:hypothetical protein